MGFCSRTVAAYDRGVSSDSAYGCVFPAQAKACGYTVLG